MTENLIVNLSVLTLFLPVIGFSILIFFGKKFPKLYLLEVGILFTTLLISIFILYSKLLHFPNSIVASFTWFSLSNAPNPDNINIELGIKIDNITAIMLFVVNLISALVHLYSIEYMRGDKRYTRYFAYLGLFTFSMLGIVLTHNLLMMYIFWELVGLSSYLLIGFWFEKKSAADASKKAFIVNRVGDIGMFLGILILFTNYNTFTFDKIFNQISIGNLPFGNETWLTIAGILIFMGAVGKSAQFPLHVWLPDAMEGPTPVSALIHAATMVAAGVYLVTRIFVMLTADAMLFIAIIGAFTSFIAATIAITQNDIKKVLAYSTISQLGYMIMSLGVGAYSFAFFHLVTHAFFKACLFLGSGSVIHAMHHEQDIRYMGGLRKKMPVTYFTFLISTLAISGIPLTSGFLSKDGILAGTLSFGKLTGHWLIPIMGFTVALLTAFYMFRLVILTFHGEPKDHHKFEHAHESPFVMITPLIILSILSLFIFYSPNPLSPSTGWFIKWIKAPAQITPINTRFNFLQPDINTHNNMHEEIIHSYLYTETLHWAHYPTMFISLSVAGLGILLAFIFYQWKILNVDKLTEKIKPIYNFSLNKWYIDELYDLTAVGQTLNFSKFLAWFDNKVIDGVVNGTAWITKSFSALNGLFDNYVVDGLVNFTAFFSGFIGFTFKKLQTGKVQTYVVFVVFSIIILIICYK